MLQFNPHYLHPLLNSLRGDSSFRNRGEHAIMRLQERYNIIISSFMYEMLNWKLALGLGKTLYATKAKALILFSLKNTDCYAIFHIKTSRIKTFLTPNQAMRTLRQLEANRKAQKLKSKYQNKKRSHLNDNQKNDFEENSPLIKSTHCYNLNFVETELIYFEPETKAAIYRREHGDYVLYNPNALELVSISPDVFVLHQQLLMS